MKKAVERTEILRALGEVFRAHGYEGASLTLITEATGLGKGSLYHLFPDGKEQMAAEVLADIDAWFELNIYAPLHTAEDPARAIAAMIAGVDEYFHSGDRVCLVGLVALGAARDTFAETVDSYFDRWQIALASLLRRSGLSNSRAQRRRRRCASHHSGRAGAGAGAQRRQDLSPGLERPDGAIAGAAGLTLVRRPAVTPQVPSGLR
jgi:AcrR family transcriptional regulator